MTAWDGTNGRTRRGETCQTEHRSVRVASCTFTRGPEVSNLKPIKAADIGSGGKNAQTIGLSKNLKVKNGGVAI